MSQSASEEKPKTHWLLVVVLIALASLAMYSIVKANEELPPRAVGK